MNKKRMLLQACCGPCAVDVLPAFTELYDVTLFFAGNNFDTEQEFEKRLAALRTVNKELNNGAEIIIVPYNHSLFLGMIMGLENETEGGKRCEVCYRMRLLATAEYAKANGYDCFSTSLGVSPYKHSETMNKIGNEISEEIGIQYISTSIKSGKQRFSDIYYQNYCGCEFSK